MFKDVRDTALALSFLHVWRAYRHVLLHCRDRRPTRVVSRRGLAPRTQQLGANTKRLKTPNDPPVVLDCVPAVSAIIVDHHGHFVKGLCCGRILITIQADPKQYDKRE
jgi:hypothetical protein